MKYSTIAVIYNPNSTGSSKAEAEQFKSDIQSHLKKQKVELIATEYAGHAETLAYTIARSSKHPLIISSSGDGGYHEVINGSIRAQKEGATPTTGVLPAGNANDHYRNLHDKDIVDSIVNGNAKTIDVLKLTSTVGGKRYERYGHSYIGFGLTPNVGEELNKTKLNLLRESWVVLSTLFSFKPVSFMVDGKRRHFDSILFSNVESMSKYFTIAKSSRISDGKFEVTIFKRRQRLQLIALLVKASLQGLKEDSQVSSYVLETLGATLVQIDGEITKLDAKSEVKVTIEKQLLRCVI